MSWDRVIRGSQAFKSSVLTTMESREFQNKVKKLGEMDDCSQVLCKDTKQLSERELDLFKAEKKLVTDLNNSQPIRDDDSFRQALKDWNEYIKYQEERLNVQASSTNKVMIEPVKKLLAEFPRVREMIKKRDALLLEYDKWHQKVDRAKKKERTGPNIVKLDAYEKSLKAAREEFETENVELIDYMSSLYEQRDVYLTPSIQALIKLQVAGIGEGFKFYSELKESAKSAAESSSADKFSELKSLSIVDVG